MNETRPRAVHAVRRAGNGLHVSTSSNAMLKVPLQTRIERVAHPVAEQV